MTWTIERILVGIESDNLAEPARRLAMELADLFDARLELLHAVEVRGPTRGVGSTGHWAAAAKKALARARAGVEGRLALSVEHPRFAGVPSEDYVRIQPGRAAKALIERAEEFEADLLVLGPHRKRRLLDMGGTARAVLGHSMVPVWMQPHPPRPIRKILVPLDLSSSSLRVMQAARTIAERVDASVSCIHCFFPPVFAYDPDQPASTVATYLIDEHRADEFARFHGDLEAFDWGDVEVTPLEVDGDPEAEILGRHEQYDLIVMGTHGHTGLARVLGSVADAVLRQSKRGVLCVPQEVEFPVHDEQVS